MASVVRLVEAALYVDDLDAAERFYGGVLGLECIGKEAGRHIFYRAGNGVLLIFDPKQTSQPGSIPPHGASGPGHAALGIASEAMDAWRARLAERGVGIEREVHWPRGGVSLYFRDPAGNSVELVTPGCWGLPSGW
jgi:catechol 2,3-dioxygenase-like lactoylglutathione lyase family enzyme